MNRLLVVVFFSGFLLPACVTDITVTLPDPRPMIVVEGYIEQDTIPYVILSRNAPYFGKFSLNDLSTYLVHDALVVVSDGSVYDTLPEVCITINNGDRIFEACAYGHLLNPSNARITGALNKTYSLYVEVDDTILTATTTIPDLYPLDSLWWQPHSNPDNDTLVSLIARIRDPGDEVNYSRVFSKRNSEPFYQIFVTDDRFYNGQTFSIPLQRGQDPDDDFDLVTSGYFWRGDTVIIKWAAIDKAHYDFWNTLDAEMNSGGPFSSGTVIKGNIQGGLGIWGGSAVFYDTLYIPQ
ncbi:MAG: hypothetical protein KatS3mg031_0846 [Chitinophagales bacterium]|nr:MAG: hypothetical protein KatS3mg031_0846 [Chitinophagales bacterium]